MDKTGMEFELLAMCERERNERMLNEEIERACRLVSVDDGIAAVHVVPGRRPSFDELVRFRSYVDSNALRMTVHGDGSLTVRPRLSVVTAEDANEHQTGFHLMALVEQRVAAGSARMASVFSRWNAGFQGMAEGTR